MNLTRQKKAFTLAEVLITLTIVGVIAAMTIPAIVSNTNDEQYRIAFKKIYSDINQAVNFMKAENGGTLANYFDLSGNWTSQQAEELNKFAAKLNHVKKCYQGDVGCWAATKYTLGGLSSAIDSNYSYLTLTNGASLMFLNGSDSTCNVAHYNCDNFCFNIQVDVNGKKAPNVVGKDIYLINIHSDRVTPGGTCNYYADANCSANMYSTQIRNGWGCAKYALMGVDNPSH